MAMSNGGSSWPTTFKTALIQLAPKPLDAEFNFNASANYIREAASLGASLAVLPEYHLSGWHPDEEAFGEIAKTAHKFVERYQALARELQINIVPGTIVVTDPKATSADPGKPAALHNIAAFIDTSGTVLGSYTKANLWIPERAVLTSGPDARRADLEHTPVVSEGPPTAADPHSVIQTPLGPVGIVICWDLAFPESFRALTRQGARLIIVPTYWGYDDLTEAGKRYGPDADRQFLKNALITRSFENTCAIIFVNVGGNPEEYVGLSRVVLPLVGEVKGGFDDPTPGMRIVEVDMNTVDVAEENYQIRKDLAKDTWHYGYSRGK